MLVKRVQPDTSDRVSLGMLMFQLLMVMHGGETDRPFVAYEQTDSPP